MKFLFAFSSFVALIGFKAHAAFQLSPGLWDVKAIIKSDGKTFDPQAEIKKAMAKLTPEQRKQMEAMMAKTSKGNISADGMKVCLTAEMLEKDTVLMQKENKDCTMSFTEKSSTKVNAKFNCKNGTTGTAVWNIKSAGKAYDGQMNIHEGKKSKDAEVSYEGKWISSDCGKVKPLS